MSTAEISITEICSVFTSYIQFLIQKSYKMKLQKLNESILEPIILNCTHRKKQVMWYVVSEDLKA